ncbi:MAG: hypothetical protein CMO16_04505 [Thaumarchaeota archaeon]|nr:hypothetical protein [Nitrososphaerota archaeon]|tara:strand:+ start:50 stop:1498 length:1449 start_codon:yes stop_codon:yes gene_type:complete
MRNRYAFSSFIFAILIFPLANVPLNNVDAQQITLSVSAKDTGGNVFGPQIVQIVIDGPGIRNHDTSTGSLVVNDVTIPLVHLTDSRWIAFFADGSTFTTLADVIGIPGSSNENFFIIGPNNKNLLFPTLPNAIDHDPTNNRFNPNLDLSGDCPTPLSDQDPCVEWPYVRLFNFIEFDQISIRYNSQSVMLNYVKTSSKNISLSLDRDFYPINAEIIFGLSDYMWNINPVERDRIIFAFDNGNTEVFYQPSASLPAASITGVMQNLGFQFKQILSLQGKENIKFTNAINGKDATSLIEIFPNAGMFENRERLADLFAKGSNVQFRFDYLDKSISAGMGSSDSTASIGKKTPKIGIKTQEVKEKEVNIDSYSIGEPKIVDLLGRSVINVNIRQPILIQTAVTNNLDEEQPFIYIVQIKDENDFTVTLAWIKGNIYAKNSFSIDKSWTPESDGDYSIEIFLWKTIDEPGMLPLTKSLDVSVSELE